MIQPFILYRFYYIEIYYQCIIKYILFFKSIKSIGATSKLNIRLNNVVLKPIKCF